MIKYDGTVRNSLGDVIQFLYGEDGMDAVWTESQKLDSLKMKKKEFENVYKYELDQENWNHSYMLPEHVEYLKTIREFQNVFDAEVQKLESDRRQLGMETAPSGDNSWPLPVNLKKLIWNSQKTFKIDARKPLDMHPMEIVEAIDRLQERLKVVPGDDLMSIEAQKNATLFFNILNMAAGESVYGEKRISVQNEDGTKTEYRVWNPFRSKLAAAILGGVDNIWIKPGTHVLYLGAASGTTVSHVSDIVGPTGIVYAVEMWHISGRDSVNMAKKRTNVIPIIENARYTVRYRMLVGMVDVIFADVAQPDQARIVAILYYLSRQIALTLLCPRRQCLLRKLRSCKRSNLSHLSR